MFAHLFRVPRIHHPETSVLVGASIGTASNGCFCLAVCIIEQYGPLCGRIAKVQHGAMSYSKLLMMVIKMIGDSSSGCQSHMFYTDVSGLFVR